MSADREAVRQEVLPSIIHSVSGKISPIAGLFRVNSAVLLRVFTNHQQLTHVKINEDSNYTSGDGGKSGRNVQIDSDNPSLLDLVPLCPAKSTCGFGCGCRCSSDLGYTRKSKPFSIAVRVHGGEIYFCRSVHETSFGDAPMPEKPSLNVEKMVQDMEVQL